MNAIVSTTKKVHFEIEVFKDEPPRWVAQCQKFEEYDDAMATIKELKTHLKGNLAARVIEVVTETRRGIFDAVYIQDKEIHRASSIKFPSECL